MFLLGQTWQGQAGTGAPGLEGLKGSVPENLAFSPEGLWLSVSEVPCVLFANVAWLSSLLTSAQSPLQMEEKILFSLVHSLGISHRLAQDVQSELSVFFISRPPSSPLMPWLLRPLFPYVQVTTPGQEERCYKKGGQASLENKPISRASPWPRHQSLFPFPTLFEFLTRPPLMTKCNI